MSLLKTAPKVSWQGEYSEGELRYSVDCQSWECPITAITGKSVQLLHLAGQTRRLKEGYGITPFDPSKAPAEVVDAFDVIERARIEEHNARMDAETAASRQR